jgi:hypothetical protein
MANVRNGNDDKMAKHDSRVTVSWYLFILAMEQCESGLILGVNWNHQLVSGFDVAPI